MVRWGIMGRSVGRMMGTKKANILCRYYYLFIFNSINNEKLLIENEWIGWWYDTIGTLQN